jgi:hypothetical protein
MRVPDTSDCYSALEAVVRPVNSLEITLQHGVTNALVLLLSRVPKGAKVQ